MLALTFMGCPPGILDPHEGDGPADPCMEGEFVYRLDGCVVPGCPDCTCEVTFLMRHEADRNDEPSPPVLVNGVVGMSVVHSGTLAPWDSLYFSGEVTAVGEARGNLEVSFPDVDVDSYTAEDVVLRLSDSAEGCPDSLDLEAFTYTDRTATPERSVTESYTATRAAPCTRRRPTCE
jgi:hypothetical protein